MTTWLPAICTAIVVLFTMWWATDPMFSHGRDRRLGAILGAIAGLVVALIVYSLVRFVAWAM